MEPLLAMGGIQKAFPGVQALRGVDFAVFPGEVHALIGENGAGKSTLVKILAGVYGRDGGEIRLEGQPVVFREPREALEAGISVIYQEFNLVPALTVAQNIFLGREPLRLPGVLHRTALVAQARTLLQELGVEIDPRAPVRRLGVAERQMVEIAKALSRSARILVMDEPTAPLTTREIEILFRVIRRLQERAIGVIYISHRLEEVFQVADRVTVLRDGLRITAEPVHETDVGRLVFAMVGRHLEQAAAPPAPPSDAPVVLEVHDLADGERVHGMSVAVRAGEVVGLAGLIGSGRSEFAHLIFGARRAAGGTVHLRGRPVVGSVGARIRAGLGMVPEDRKLQGLVLQLLVRDNATLASLQRYASAGLLRRQGQDDRVRRLMGDLRIAARGPRQSVQALSGGNQQKVILARWMDTGADALILDEPTRGVDVASKAEIYGLIRDLQSRGVAILLISSDLPEVLRVSNRVVAIREGRVAGQLPREAASQESLLRLMMGAGNGARAMHSQEGRA